MNTWNWWDDLMNKHRKQGRTDAMKGIYQPPNATVGRAVDPQEQAENESYQDGWSAEYSKRKMIPV